MDSETLKVALRQEIERQCGIGAGTFTIDDGFAQSGLWIVNADLDPTGLVAALANHSEDARVERLREAWADGFQSARDCLTEDEGFCLTEDVEYEAWGDSKTLAALLTPSESQ